jgi:hypothetical protein
MCRWLGVLFLLTLAEGRSQGLIVFNNRVQNEVIAPVYNLEPSNPALPKVGNAGSTLVYNGAPLSGADYTAQVFGGPTNTPASQLAALSPATTFLSNASAGFVIAPNRAVAVPGVSEGQSARVLLRAWHNRGGTITNWSQLLADPTIPHGESLPFITLPLGSVFTPPPNLIGLQSFNLVTPVRLTSPRFNAREEFQLDYLNATTVPYRIESSVNLSNWTTLTTIPPGSGTTTDSTPSSRRFYRVVPAQ